MSLLSRVFRTGDADVDQAAKYASDAFDNYRYYMSVGDEAGAAAMLAIAMETIGLDGFGTEIAGNDTDDAWVGMD